MAGRSERGGFRFWPENRISDYCYTVFQRVSNTLRFLDRRLQANPAGAENNRLGYGGHDDVLMPEYGGGFRSFSEGNKVVLR